MKTMQEMREQLVTRANTDEAFRAELLSKPKEAIESELGVTLPEQMKVSVYEDSATEAHFVLPPEPRLDAQDLEHASGGVDSGDCYCYG